MDPKEFHSKIQKPESKIQEEILSYLRTREWFARPVGPSAASCGWPDLYCTHVKYGPRWVEVKRPVGYSFTPAQISTFPLLGANGAGVWVITAATDDEMNKLFRPPNWELYLNVGIGALLRPTRRNN